MPVMTRIITADSASSRSARLSEKSPAVIHVNSVWLICRFSGAMALSDSTCITANPNDITMTSVARPPDTDFGNRFPRKALTRKPPNGRSGISANKRSPFERRERFGIERFAMAEEPDHERQADRGFSRRDGHHEERDDLAVDRALLPPEGDKGEVDGVQHDFNRHQQRDQVAAQEHAGRADREQQPGQHQVVADRHQSSLFRDSTTAPTSAATDDIAGLSSATPTLRPLVRASAQPSSSASSAAITPPTRTAIGRYSGW